MQVPPQMTDEKTKKSSQLIDCMYLEDMKILVGLSQP